MNSRKENRKWHWVFWIAYSLINHLVFSPERFIWQSIAVTVIFSIHNAGTAYVVLDWWIPKYYHKKQYVSFAIAVIATILTFALFLFGSLLAYFSYFEPFPINLNLFFEQFAAPAFLSNFTGIAFLITPYYILQRIEMERRNNQLEKEKLAAELQLLKSQLHPHFLFNALNNIYFLIKKDPDTAAEALAGFSNLLRFQLYEANNSTVSLQQEIDYLQQFAEIAQLRKGENFKVNWELPKNIADIKIAPLLLMPLVENAFKHGPNKNGQIDVSLTIEKNKLQFRIVNSKELDKSQGVEGFEEGGIGLANIQKRLQLLYPQRHELAIENLDKQFMVNLIVDLV